MSPLTPSSFNNYVIEVARAQQWVLIALVVSFVATLLQAAVQVAGQSSNSVAVTAVSGVVVLAIVLASTGFRLWSIYMLGKALQLTWTWVAVIFSLVPCLGLVILLVLNNQATNALRAAGLRVGLMGVNKADLQQYIQNQSKTANPSPFN